MRGEMARWIVLMCMGLLGCGSPLVGLECRDGYERCGEACYDLHNDARHCGGCGLSCDHGEVCIESMCVVGLDGAIADGGPADASASSDAGSDASVFPPVPPRCTGSGSPANCTCGYGELKCGLNCVSAGDDPANCGLCGHECVAGAYCVQGTCLAQCDSPLTACGESCVDLTTNASCCGACGRQCVSGICSDGQCLGATAGHVIALGHDMSRVTPATRRLFGNSVFLPPADPVRVLVFDQKASAAAKVGVTAALDATARSTGRSYTVTQASPLTVNFLLASSDVFLIEAQVDAKNSSLLKDGQNWSLALKAFLKRGGVVVLLEGKSTTNAGTYQILNSAGIFHAKGRIDVGAKTLSLVAAGDAVATGVPSVYSSGSETCGFETDEQTVVVQEPKSEAPVVIHVAR